ncbi:hypothetical protein FTX61_13530 [Nitriliruptoraceae bacterium ZYF776]|nr:hypothetical protein [Profundirhabdus halotolerans]
MRWCRRGRSAARPDVAWRGSADIPEGRSCPRGGTSLRRCSGCRS